MGKLTQPAPPRRATPGRLRTVRARKGHGGGGGGSHFGQRWPQPGESAPGWEIESRPGGKAALRSPAGELLAGRFDQLKLILDVDGSGVKFLAGHDYNQQWTVFANGKRFLGYIACFPFVFRGAVAETEVADVGAVWVERSGRVYGDLAYLEKKHRAVGRTLDP